MKYAILREGFGRCRRFLGGLVGSIFGGFLRGGCFFGFGYEGIGRIGRLFEYHLCGVLCRFLSVGCIGRTIHDYVAGCNQKNGQA